MPKVPYRIRVRLHLVLVQRHIPEPAEFAADLTLSADQAKAHRQMQANGGFVRERDSAVGAVHVLVAQRLEQDSVELPTSAAPRVAGRAINASFHRGGVRFL